MPGIDVTFSIVKNSISNQRTNPVGTLGIISRCACRKLIQNGGNHVVGRVEAHSLNHSSNTINKQIPCFLCWNKIEQKQLNTVGIKKFIYGKAF